MKTTIHTIPVLPATLALLLFLCIESCSTTKYIADNQYLLNKVSIETDSTEISKTNLMDFIKQKPNDSKLGLMIYNWVDNDSGWFKKLIRKLGEPPVIYNAISTNQSINELSIEVKNRGFVNAYIHAVTDTAGKKISVCYHVHEGIPYRIKEYAIRFPNKQMNDLAQGIRSQQSSLERFIGNPFRNRSRNENTAALATSLIKPDLIFDMALLREEMLRVSNRLRNRGYYALTVDNLHYWADTALNTNQVNLTLVLKDSTLAKAYRIEKVNVFSGYDPLNSENYKIVDSLENKGITIYYDSLRFLRPNVLADKVTVRPGSLFRERADASTYGLFQALNCINRVNLIYKEGNYPDSTLLDCEVYLTPGNIHSVQTRLGGTNNAGDMGVALDINYGHLNLFNGSELFNIQLKGAYEFVAGKTDDNSINHNFYEFGIMPSLTFPKLHLPFLKDYFKERYNTETKYSLGFDIQNRPEYTRDFFNFNWQIRWADRNNRVTHTVGIVDVNYVAMPWKSERFQKYLKEEIDPLARLSYSDVFTAGLSYNLLYTNANSGKASQNLYVVRLNVESSGNALHGIFALTGAEKNEAGQYKVGGNPFAQYLKAGIDFTETVPLSGAGKIAFHTSLGLAYPYKNSMILPFEKRYFAGGPNSVRGWRTRYLGPGSFNQGMSGDPTTHVGDISFIASAEYRYKVLKWLEPAFFIDCGNIWTIKDYENQPGGLFRWDSFYKELAVGTGIGLRLDFGFFIFRIDAGTRIYDPARPANHRFLFLKDNLWRNSAAYIAIGYPF